MSLGKKSLSDSAVEVWKVISFFSLESGIQEASLGPADEWFAKENDKNKGANYLLGMLLYFIERRNGMLDELYPDYDDLSEISMCVNDLLYAKDKDAHSIEALRNDDRWEYLRDASRKFLSSKELFVNAPKNPYWFADLLEVDRYQEWWKQHKKGDGG